MSPEQTLGRVPVQRTCGQKLREFPVLPCLTPVTGPAQPAQVVRRECPEHRGWAEGAGYIYRKAVVHLVGWLAAHLAERMLYLLRMLTRSNAVSVQAVGVPARPDMRRRLIAPAADAVDRRLFPTGRPVHKASWMLCSMAPVVQHEAPEMALSDRSLHGLPRPLKWRFYWGLSSVYYTTGTPVIRQKTGMLWYYCPHIIR